MKRFLKDLRQRISDALKLLFCGRYSLYMFQKGSTDCFVYRNVAEDAVEKCLHKFLTTGKFPQYCSGGRECVLARRQIIEVALDPDVSVVMLFKKYGSSYVVYDCQSQSDFDELINQKKNRTSRL